MGKPSEENGGGRGGEAGASRSNAEEVGGWCCWCCSGSSSGGGGGRYNNNNNTTTYNCGGRFVKLKCLIPLLLGISVLLPALFWLPPFLHLADPTDTDLDPRFRGHIIVASFKLLKPTSFLENNIEQLEADIYYELEAANTKVVVLALESSGLNETDIVFAVDPASEHSSVSPAEQSLIRASFQYLVIRQTNLHLTVPLFGEPSFFEVLKFPGGITVSPVQFAYPLQKVQILFNFTLNNSILQIQDNFDALKDQLKSGLHLTDNENLYIRLTNSRGSTVAPPATVQTTVVLKVGVPSQPRLKQLAQTIRDSPARNLGLNNTVFGKVKQVSLSSVLQHSLGDGSSPTPAPSPTPLPHHHHHHHHHHHDHHHHHLPPTIAPTYSPVETPHPVKRAPSPHRNAPSPVKSHGVIRPFAPSAAPVKSYQASPHGAPAPVKSYQASPPGCRSRFRSKHSGKSPEESPTVAAIAPSISPHSVASPRPETKSPTAAGHRLSPSSPLPTVIYARVLPPSTSEMDPEPPDKMPSVTPSPSTGGHISVAYWAYSLFVPVLLHLW